MILPAPVGRYFEAERHHDIRALADAFAPDAVVRDEGAQHEGQKAICTWWLAAKSKYQYVADPIDFSETDGTVSVQARVSGRFSNSPATLRFSFTLAEDQIASLEIG